MRFRRIALWAVIDVLGTSLGVALMSVHPINAKTDGVKPKAEYLIEMTYDVQRDVDLDLWLNTPSHKPVFYGSREVGCSDLDRDSLGFNTSLIYLADGSQVRAKANVETTSIRCLNEAGRYDVAVNLFSFHSDHGDPITAHVEVTGLNPSVRTVWAGDVTLTHLGETQNVVSFELNRDGSLGLVDKPLVPVTTAYERAKAGSPP